MTMLLLVVVADGNASFGSHHILDVEL